MSDTFKCDICGGVFKKGWSDEEAAAESEELFGETPTDETHGVACDDCFKAMSKSFGWPSETQGN